MATFERIETILRGIRRGGASAGNDYPLTLNEYNEQIVSQGLAIGTEMTRQGLRWSTMSTSAVAGLVVRPSTTAAFEIYNGYPAGGKSLIVERLFWFQLVSVTAVAEAYVGYAGVTSPKAAVTDGSFVVRGSHGVAARNLPVIAAASTTIVDPGWFPWAVNGGHAAITGTAGGFGAIGEVAGRLIVPPGCSLVMHAVANTTGQTFVQGSEWVEQIIDVQR